MRKIFILSVAFSVFGCAELQQVASQYPQAMLA